MAVKLLIPKKENLASIPFEYLDSTIDQYYRPVQGYFMRKRLEIALKLLGDQKTERILDIGYGGGTFFPSLDIIGRQLYGIDIHQYKDRVHKILKKEGIDAKLYNASVFKLPFKDNFFDRVVCISVLEHFKGKELDKAIEEINR